MITNFFKDLSKRSDEAEFKNRIIINIEQQETRVAFMIDQRLDNFFIERNSTKPSVGNIYLGVVQDILPSIQAAFIDIGEEKNGFIHVQDVKENFAYLFDRLVDGNGSAGPRKSKPNISITDVLQKGQKILVQVRKEAIGTKGARLTSNITLPGRNLVLIPYTNRRGISRKITNRDERIRLKELIKSIDIPGDYGVIVRTAGSNASVRNFEMDINYLAKSWQMLLKTVDVSGKKTGCVHNESDIAIKILRDMDIENIDEIIVDCKESYLKIKKYFRYFFPNASQKVFYYRRKTPIFDYYAVEQELLKIFQRKVWLKCGGYIIIDETEALIAIDVNSGRNLKHKNLEKTVMVTNCEAAVEVARQLRLRNMGGIVVIDFIDMAKRENRKAVLNKLQESLKHDKAKTNILPLSAIGLVEMTRQRMKESINQELYEKCTHCNGRGIIKSILSISIETVRKIKSTLIKTREKKIKIVLNPEILDKIMEDSKSFHTNLERAYRKKIILATDKSLEYEQIKIEYLSSEKTEYI